MTIDEITKKWLNDNPPDLSLPKGWEFRFGMRGRFMKYDSLEHAERKHMFEIRETGVSLPFGYANQEWQLLKSNFQAGDELWLYGGEGMMVFIVRDGNMLEEMCGQWKYPRRGHHIFVGYF